MAYVHGRIAAPDLAETSDFGAPIVIAKPVTQTLVQRVLLLPDFKLQDNKLQPEHIKAIKDFAKIVAADKSKGRVLKFVGHTDPSGPPALNLRLGIGRAQQAMLRMSDELDALGEFGVDRENLMTTGAATRLGRSVEIVFERPAPLCGPPGDGELRGFGEPVATRVPDTRPGRPADLNLDRFEFKLSLVPPVHRAAIDALADRIVAVARRVPGPVGKVELFGHADFIGERSYNNPLGLLRAKAVRGVLATALEARLRGVTSRVDIIPVSLGEDYPVDPSDRSDEGRARSRRVQVYVTLAPIPKPPPPIIDLWHQKLRDPDGPKPPPYQQRTPIDENLRKKIPKSPRKCVNPYDVVVKFLRKLLDKALSESHIPQKYHARIRQLAEQRAADLRDDLIDKGLDEIGLHGQLRDAARRLIVDAIQQACF